MKRFVKTVPFVLACVMLSACVQAPKDAGFSEVQKNVGERLNKDVEWDRGSAEDAQVSDRVKQMLADDLTADEATQIALLNNRHLQATYESLGLAQADLVQAGLFKNPIFSIGYGFVEGDGSSSSPDDTTTTGTRSTLSRNGSAVPLHTPHIPPPVTGGGGTAGGATASGATGDGIFLGVAFDFLDLIYAPMRTKIAAEGLEEAKAMVAADVLTLAASVRNAYFEMQSAQQRFELRQIEFKAAELSHELSQRLNRAGNMTELQFAIERAEFERSRAMLAIAEANLTTHRERLNRLMGLWAEDTNWRISAKIPEPPAEEIAAEQLESRAVASSFELEAIRRRINGASRALGLSKSTNLIPELGVGISAARSDGVWSGGPSISVPIPLFDWGQARRAALITEIRRERQRYIAAAIDLRSHVREAYARLMAARALEAHYRRAIVPLHGEIVAQTQAEYNAMLTDPLQLLSAKQQETQARVEYLERLLDYWQARTQMEQLLNGGLPLELDHSNTLDDASTGVGGGGGHH